MTYSNKISKEKFCKILNQLRAAEDLKTNIDRMIFEATEIETDFLSGYGLSIDHGGLVTDLLDAMFGGDYVGWWCWESDFGRALEPDSAEINYHPVDLRTAEQLYDFLTSDEYIKAIQE